MSQKKLGFGLMRLPSLDPNDASKIDIEQTKKMVDTFIEKGFTYFDTAWMYCGFASENAAKEALVSRYPRDAYTLATKLHSGFIKTKEDRDHIFNEQLSKTGVEYFDYYLNKATFNNGMDLRNMYLHGSQPNGSEDEKIHMSNYWIILKLFVLCILKICDDIETSAYIKEYNLNVD